MQSEPRVKILLVDDQPNNLLALEAVLAGLGQDLVTAHSGKDALRRVLDDEYAVILMDVQMPIMDGFETAELIRQRDRSRHTPILFLTAYQQNDEQIFRGYSLGAVDYLFKPIVPEVLRSKVSVFVELFQKTEQVKRQAELLRANQRREIDQRLTEEKRRWEVERLRAEAAQEKKIAAALAHEADTLARTVAERTRAEHELSQVKDELAVQLADMTRLHQLSVRLSNTLDLPGVLEEVLAAVTGLQGTDLGVLMLYDRERHDLVMTASVGLSAAYLELVGRVPSGAGACGAAVAQRRPVIIDDVEADPGFSPSLPAARLADYRAVYSIPLLTRNGAIVGAIATYWRQPHRPSDREIRLVELYARQAAESIDNARLYREIQEANRRKDEFLAMLGHELRNPLAPIFHALHLMRLHAGDGAVVEEARDMVERQVRHMARLVDDLLDVSRITRGKIQLRREPVELAAIVARAVESSHQLFTARRHHLEVAAPPEPLWLDADPTRLEQVLANLLNNAAKYTEPGGRINLTTEHQEDAAVLRLRDTGIGIPPEMLPRVFDLFTQVDRSLDRSQGGLGIGLTLVRSLVEMHGGSIAAHSAGPGQGSEFVIRLPLLRGPAAAMPAAAPAPVPATACPRRVLVVDDNRDAAKSLSGVLKLEGHEVHVAYDGPEALEAARACRPDVVLLDLGLPGMSGYEVARQLRDQESTRAALLVAVTGYGQEEDCRRSYEAGFDHHLIKPVEPQTLHELLARSAPPTS